MKIACPIKNINNLDELVASGADEFYAGVIFSNCNSNMRSENKEFANFSCMGDIGVLLEKLSKNNQELFLTVNRHDFEQVDFESYYNLLQSYKNVGGKNVIVSDINIIKIADSLDLNLAIGSDFGVYSMAAINFLKSRYVNLKRIILPRDISVSEINVIKKGTDLEIEVFGSNGHCRYSNGLCLSNHDQTGALCVRLDNSSIFSRDYDKKKLYSTKRNNMELNHLKYSWYLNGKSCSKCAIYNFLNMGIDSIKIVGREQEVVGIISEVREIRSCIKLAACSSSNSDYEEVVKKIESADVCYSCSDQLYCSYKKS